MDLQSAMKGKWVRVTDGPFRDFRGEIEGIDLSEGKVNVLVSILGRKAPVVLDLNKVERT